MKKQIYNSSTGHTYERSTRKSKTTRGTQTQIEQRRSILCELFDAHSPKNKAELYALFLQYQKNNNTDYAGSQNTIYSDINKLGLKFTTSKRTLFKEPKVYSFSHTILPTLKQIRLYNHYLDQVIFKRTQIGKKTISTPPNPAFQHSANIPDTTLTKLLIITFNNDCINMINNFFKQYFNEILLYTSLHETCVELNFEYQHAPQVMNMISEILLYIH